MSDEIEQKAITLAVRAPGALLSTGRNFAALVRSAAKLSLDVLRGSSKLAAKTIDTLSASDPMTAKKKIRDYHLDEMQAVSGKDVRQLRREFNRNGINFAVKRSPTKGEYIVFFNAQDSNRMRQSFETVLAKQSGKVAVKRPPMIERLAIAEKEAAKREAARNTERSKERTVKAPAKEAR